MKSWTEIFSQAQFTDVSGKEQVSIEDVLSQVKKKPITIIDYSFVTTSNGETAFILYKESPNNFFFAPTVLTNMLKQIDANADAKEFFKKNGLKVTITKTKNKKGNRTYFNFTPVD